MMDYSIGMYGQSSDPKPETHTKASDEEGAESKIPAKDSAEKRRLSSSNNNNNNSNSNSRERQPEVAKAKPDVSASRVTSKTASPAAPPALDCDEDFFSGDGTAIVLLKSTSTTADAVSQIRTMQRFDEEDAVALQHRGSSDSLHDSSLMQEQKARKKKARRPLPATLYEFHHYPPTLVVLRTARAAVIEDALSGFASYVKREESEEGTFRRRQEAQRRRMEPFLRPVRHERTFDTSGGIPRAVARPVYSDPLLGEWKGLEGHTAEPAGGEADEVPPSLMFLMRSEDEAALMQNNVLSPLRGPAADALAAAMDGEAPAEGLSEAAAEEKRERLEAMRFQSYLQERRYQQARMPGVFKYKYPPELDSAFEDRKLKKGRTTAPEAAANETPLAHAVSDFLTGGHPKTPSPEGSPITRERTAGNAVRKEWAYVWEQFCRDCPRETFFIEEQVYQEPDAALAAVLSYLDHCYTRGLAAATVERERRVKEEQERRAKQNIFEKAFHSSANAFQNAVQRLAVNSYEKDRKAGGASAYSKMLSLASGLQQSDLRAIVDSTAQYSSDPITRGKAVYQAARLVTLASQQSFMGFPYQLLCEQVGTHRMALALETLMMERATLQRKRQLRQQRKEERMREGLKKETSLEDCKENGEATGETQQEQQQEQQQQQEPQQHTSSAVAATTDAKTPGKRTTRPTLLVPPLRADEDHTPNHSFTTRQLRIYNSGGCRSTTVSLPTSPHHSSVMQPHGGECPSGPADSGDTARPLFTAPEGEDSGGAAPETAKPTPPTRRRIPLYENKHLNVPLLVGEPRQEEFDELLEILRARVVRLRRREWREAKRADIAARRKSSGANSASSAGAQGTPRGGHRESLPKAGDEEGEEGGGNGNDEMVMGDKDWFHPSVEGSAYLLPLRRQAKAAPSDDGSEAVAQRGMRVHLYFHPNLNVPLLCVNKIFRLFTVPDLDMGGEEEDDDGNTLLLLIQLTFSLFTQEEVELKWRWWSVRPTSKKPSSTSSASPKGSVPTPEVTPPVPPLKVEESEFHSA